MPHSAPSASPDRSTRWSARRWVRRETGPGRCSPCARDSAPTRRAAVIGDSPADVAMARAAGAGLVVGVRSGSDGRDLPDADVVIDSVAELLALLGARPRGDPRQRPWAAPHATLRCGVRQARVALVPVGYRRATHRTVPFPNGRRPPSTDGHARRPPDARRIARRRCRRVPPRPRSPPRCHPADVTGDPRAPRTIPRGPTRSTPCAGSPPRSAAGVTLTGLFDDVIDEAFALFGVDRAGLWRYDADRDARSRSPPTVASPGDHRAIARLPRDARTTGMDAIRDRRVRVLDRAMRSTTAAPSDGATARSASGSCASCRSCSATTPLGLLVLYHRETYALARRRARAGPGVRRPHGDGDRRGSAWPNRTRTLADRLTSIAELAGRLEPPPRSRGASPARSSRRRSGLIDHDTIRVYRVDHDTGMCEPIAFEGTFLGRAETRHPETPARADRQGPDGLGRRARSPAPARRRARRPARIVVVGDRRARVDAHRPDGPGGGRPRRDRRVRHRRRTASTPTTR